MVLPKIAGLMLLVFGLLLTLNYMPSMPSLITNITANQSTEISNIYNAGGSFLTLAPFIMILGGIALVVKG